MSTAATTAFWHGQAHMPTVKRAERVIVRGEGAFVWDADGNRLFDATASLWYCNIGHGRREIAEAVFEQMTRIEAYATFQQYATPPPLELSERLAAIAPFPSAKVFLTSGGSDAIDVAAKLARRYWNAAGQPEKQTLVTRARAYHGLHGIGTSITGLDFNREGFGRLVPDTARVPTNDAEALAELFASRAEEIAAFICEPVIGTGGVIPPEPGYLETAGRLCREHDVLFVADEVITGFGRTGRMFASERFGIQPDMLVFAKGVTSGYMPVGGVLVGERIWDPFWADGSDLIFRHGLTYSGHASACAAAIANLDVLERERLVDRVAELEPVLVSELAPLAELPRVAEVRCGVGLLAGVELADAALVPAVLEGCHERGVLTRLLAPSTLQVSPPFVATGDDLATMVSVFGEAIEAA
jgi:adenosylmethionine-8-amino-7-oxononanoate aminotransferase